MEKLKKERSTAKRKFNRKVVLFRNSHMKGDSVETLQVLYSEVCECFTAVDAANEQMIGLLEDETLCQEYEDYIMELETKMYCT